MRDTVYQFEHDFLKLFFDTVRPVGKPEQIDGDLANALLASVKHIVRVLESDPVEFERFLESRIPH